MNANTRPTYNPNCDETYCPHCESHAVQVRVVPAEPDSLGQTLPEIRYEDCASCGSIWAV